MSQMMAMHHDIPVFVHAKHGAVCVLAEPIKDVLLYIEQHGCVDVGVC